MQSQHRLKLVSVFRGDKIEIWFERVARNSLCVHRFLRRKVNNALTVIVAGKNNVRLDLRFLQYLVFQTKERRCDETLGYKLSERNELFPTVTVKPNKKIIRGKFLFDVVMNYNKCCTKNELFH